MVLDEKVYLEHFGKKGMRWGVRNKRDNLKNQSSKSEEKDRKNKRIAIVLGSTAVVAAIGAGAYYTKKHFNTKISNVPKASQTVKGFAKALADEPVHMVHSSRGVNRGYAFLQGGGMKNPSTEFIKAGLDQADNGFFKRYGDAGEKIAARFADPEGRKDFSGRLIGHDVVLPKSMSKDVNNINDVVAKTWPKIKPLFDAFYGSESGTFGPGF